MSRLQKDLLKSLTVVAVVAIGLWLLLRLFSAEQLEMRDANIRNLQGGIPWLVDLTGPEFGDRDLKIASAITSVEEIRANNSNITDASASAFSQFKKLKTLSLHDTGVADKTAEVLSRLTTLETLNLDGTKVTMKGLRLLSSLPNLTKLSINRVPVSLEEVFQFQELDSQAELIIDGNTLLGIPEEVPLRANLGKAYASRTFSKPPRFNLYPRAGLRHEPVVAVPIDPEHIRKLNHPDLITSAFLNRSIQNIDECLAEYSRFENLSTLRIEAEIGQQAIDSIGDLSNLTDLYIITFEELPDLETSQFRIKTLEPLTHLRKLEKLTIWNQSVDPNTFSELEKLPRLQNLSLIDCGLEDQHILFVKNISELRSLSLSHDQLTDKSLKILRQLPISIRLGPDGNSTAPE